jgi:DnaK suppressor protein
LIAHGVLPSDVVYGARFGGGLPMNIRIGAVSCTLFGSRARDLHAKRRAWSAVLEAKENAVNAASPEGQRIEAHLRHRYSELWTDIRRELDKHGEQQYVDLVQGAGDPEDAATADVLVHLNLSEIERDARELQAVQDALARLKRGEYGECQTCGEEIPAARLEAMPQATLCVECQTRAERTHATPNTPSL